MNIYIELEDLRYCYLKEWLEKDYHIVKDLDDADVVILGLSKKKFLNSEKYKRIISYNRINSSNNYALSDCEKLLQKNAYLTALGCLKMIDCSNKKVVIFGNGRIASYLNELLDYKATIICRHPKTCSEKTFDSIDYLNADIIINTIPYQLDLDLRQVSKKTKIIDLASKPYGFNHEKLRESGYDIQLLSGIPGKVFPKEAAQILYLEVMKCLKDLK